tara:strand:+ start:505 stop:2604 length:2100 start_codon:yes stop_codon:yes gene_type:complete
MKITNKYFLIIFLIFGWIALGKTTQGPMKSSPEKRIIDKGDQSPFRNRDIDIIYSDGFEGDIAWDYDAGWELTESDYNSPSHSFNSPNDAGTQNGSWNLLSPVISIPQIGPDDIVNFGFHLYTNQVDSDGDGDNFLEDYYSVSMMDLSELAWHTSSFNAFNGMSYWCGKEDIDGYLDSWLQFLDSPPIAIPSSGYELTTMMAWGIESPAGAEVAGTCTDGWDAANVRVSKDGGSTWDLLTGSDPYDFEYGYGWIWNDAEYDCGGDLEHLASGWGDQADWHEVTFNLDSYAGEEVIIRFAFGSDPAYCTPDDATLTGFRVDDILVSNSSGDVLFGDDADENSEMTGSNAVWVYHFYDYWDDGSLGGGVRPGSLGWEEYLPGQPFNGNVFLDITEYGGKDVIFRIQSRYDDNDDGGQGLGLFIDDFKVYKIPIPEIPLFPPQGWTTTTNSAVGWFVTQDGSSTYWAVPTHTSWYACSNDDAADDDGSVDYLDTPAINLSSYVDAILDFESFFPGDYGQTAHVLISTNSGSTFSSLYDLNIGSGWESVTIPLSNYLQSNIVIRFHSNDNGLWATGWAIDDIQITSGEGVAIFEEGFELNLATEESLYETPVSFTLYPNYPNPFNPLTALRYELPVKSQVVFSVYDIQGREIKTLVSATQEPGVKSVIWNGTDSFGRPVSAGVYLYQIQIGNFVQTQKMILLK